MHDSVVIIGEDQAIRFVNRAARENLSIRIGDLCSAVLGSDEQNGPRPCPNAWKNESRGVRIARRIGERDYEVAMAPLLDPDGQSALIAVFRDITERLLFEKELRESQGLMRELAAHVERVREEERTGIARELHDELGQLLTALKMDVNWLSSHAGTHHDTTIATKLDGMRSLVDTTVSAVQRISSELRPGLLDDLGLVAALEWLAREFKARSGIPCVLDMDDNLELGDLQSTALFRICQESLTNVARHSGATLVTITLLANEAGIVLSVRDNGKGMSLEQSVLPNSFGLIGMRERARAIGGELEVVGKPGHGTSIEVTLTAPSS
jgi:two-component system sensor kinase